MVEGLANSKTFKLYIFTWMGQLFSIMGSSVVFFSLSWWITIETGSPTLLSLTIFMFMLPMALLTPVAGVLADRMSRKKIILIADSLQALTTFAVILLFYFNVADPLTVVLVTGLRGIFQAFHMPTVGAITPTMVPKEHLSRMNGINYLFTSLINIFGPIIGATLVELIPIQSILWMDIFTFLIAAIPLLIIKIPSVKGLKPLEESKGFLSEFKTGIKIIRLIPGLLTILLLSMLLNFLIMPLNVLAPYYIAFVHGGGAAELAFVMVFFQIGMVLGGLLTSLKKEWKHKIFTYFLTLTIVMFGFSLFGLAPKGAYFLMAIVLALGGFLLPIGNTIYMTIIQTTVPQDKMGRVISIDQALSTLISPIGALISGPIADWIGVRTIFVLSSAIGTLACIYTWRFTKVRKTNYDDKAAVEEITEEIANRNH